MPEKENDIKLSRSNIMRSQGALTGKCQRVVVAPEASDESEVRPTQRKTSSNEVLDLLNEDPVKKTSSQNTKKPDLSKYMDDNLRNFDLLVKRKERSSTCSSGENTNHSTGSKNSKEQQITESSLSAAAKEHSVKASTDIANPSKTETPSKRGKAKPTTAKFSIDAVDSPKGKAVPVVSSSLASAIARSAMARTKTTSAAVEAPVVIAANDRVPIANTSSSQPKAATALNTSVENPGCTADNQHTSTNTGAVTLAFKSNPAECAVNPGASSLASSEPVSNMADALEASKPKRVSFIAPPAPINLESASHAPAPAPMAQPAGSVTPKHAQRAAHTQSSASRNPTTSSVDSSISGSKGSVSQQSSQSKSQLSQQSVVSAPATLSGGILSDAARFVEVNGRQYIRLNVLGKGGSSCVYRIIGVDDGQIYAYKRVEVRDSEDTEAVFDSYANEIALLRRLSATHQHNNNSPTSAEATAVASTAPAQSRIIELIDSEVRRDRNYISMILEAGDIDLAKVLTQKNSRSVSSSGVVSGITGTEAEKSPQALLDPFFARMVWREMLEAVDHIHRHRIVHGDLKPANFVFVKGHLKLIDFGIAKSFSSDTTNIYRESQIGTINYMAPEAIAPMTSEETDAHPHHSHNDNDRLKMRLGRASDIWSLGCILYQMVYGRPPFAALNTIQKLSVIPNPKHTIKYADWGDADAVDSMKACLRHDARQRSKIAGPGGLLTLPYLQVPHNTRREAGGEMKGATNESTQPVGAVGKEQMHCIVGAVLDSLHNVAQQAAEKIQITSSTRGTRSTRSGRGNAETEAAQKLAQGIVQWIDQVDQGAVESEVMEVVQEQHWPVPALPALVVETRAKEVVPTVSVPVEAAALMATVVAAPSKASTVKASIDTNTAAPSGPAVSTARAAVASPGSPYIAPKRKIDDITPGSVTRSASKAQRTAQENLDSVHAEPLIDESARKVQIKGLKDIKKALHIPPFVPSSGAKVSTTSNKTPSHASPRAHTVRPAFLHTLGGKIPGFPSLHAAGAGAGGGATPSRIAASSTSNNSINNNANVTIARRSPLKALPLTLQQQILNSAALRNRHNSENGANISHNEQPVVDRAAKWMRPLQETENNSMRSVVEKRLSAMRQFLTPDQDDPTSTETGFYF